VGSSIPRKIPPPTGCFVGQTRYFIFFTVAFIKSLTISGSRISGSRAQDGVTDGESKGERGWNVVYANYGRGMYHCGV
jgi:hypothetical protein